MATASALELGSMGGSVLFTSLAPTLVMEHEMLQEAGEKVGPQAVVAIAEE